ncbi:MAG: hypothetical protein SO031_01270, partial [Candidatus Ventricola sp.]|nr:hypothetical protein [Candidatus Ventricola sp.]
MAAILYTLLFLLGGVTIIRMQLPGKSPLTRVFLGLTLGVLLEMVLPALCANIWGFTLAAPGAAAALLLAIGGASICLRDSRPVRSMTKDDQQMLAAMAAVVLPLT